MSARSQVYDALWSALDAIRAGSLPDVTFLSGCVEVYKSLLTPGDFHCPCYVLAQVQEEREVATYLTQRGTLRFEVWGLSSQRDDDGVRAELEALVDDVERSLGADVTLGLASLGVQARVTAVEGYEVAESRNWHKVTIHVETPYRFTRGTP